MTHSSNLKSHIQTLQSDSIQGSGAGSPPWCMTPASVESESAHSKSAQTTSFRISDSPVVKGLERGGRAPAVTLYPTPELNEDHIRFRALAERREFEELKHFCFERLLQARDPQTSLRWQTNASIALALQRKFGEARGLLASASYVASLVTGSLRARYENEFGLVLVEFSRPSLAIERFDRAIEEHGGDPLATGQVWNNRAVAMMVLGEESEALRCLASAVELIKPTGDVFSLEETRETQRRVIKFFEEIK